MSLPQGPGIFYPRPFLIVAARQRDCEWLARHLEFDRNEWRPITAPRDVNGHRVRAAFYDDPHWKGVEGWEFTQADLRHAVHRHVYVSRTALEHFRARTRAQALQASEAEDGSGSVAVPYGDYANVSTWGQATYTVEGPIVELERYAPHGAVTEVHCQIALRDGGRCRATVRRPDFAEELIGAFRNQNSDGPWVFLAEEVDSIDRPGPTLAEANRNGDIIVGGFNVTTGSWVQRNRQPSEGIGQQDAAMAYLELGRSEREATDQMREELARYRAAQAVQEHERGMSAMQAEANRQEEHRRRLDQLSQTSQQARNNSLMGFPISAVNELRRPEIEQLEQAREQLQGTTRNSEEAQATMEIALRMARTSGMSVVEAINAITHLRQMTSDMTAASDNTDRIMRDLQATLDAEPEAKPKPEPTRKPKLTADFEPPKRKIDLED